MHNHSKCEHSLKFCKDCDVVYCETCKEEWKKTTSWTLGGGTTTLPYNGTPNFYCGDPMNNIALCSGTCNPNHTH